MDACGCDGLAATFDRRTAEHDRDRYERTGPDATTRMLLDRIATEEVRGATVLDVGGGIGVIDRELLRVGAERAVIVEASPAYLEVAAEDARRAGFEDRIELHGGDFVRLAPELAAADIVTLDRVVCCYSDVDALVSTSASHARRVYALVLPRDRAFIRVAARVLNLWYRARRSADRAYVHSNRRVDELVARAGLRLRSEARTFVWRVVVYAR
jgi:SAM-dependent methyltransferase